MLGYDAYNLEWGMCGWTSADNINKKWATLVPSGQTLETTANALTTTYPFPEITPHAASVEEAIKLLADEYLTAGVKGVSADSLYTLLDDGDPANDPFVISYLPENNYNAGHIAGSFRFNPGSFGTEELAHLPTDRMIVVVSYIGHIGCQLTSYLNILGYDANVLKYGMNSISADPAVLNNPSTGQPYTYPPPPDYPVVKSPPF